MKDALMRKRAELADLYKEQKTFFDNLGDSEPTADQATAARERNKKIETLSADVKNLEDMAGYAKTAADYLEEYNTPANQLPQNRGALERDAEERSKGRARVLDLMSARDVVNSEAFKAWRQSGANGASPKVAVRGTKDLVTGASSTSGGAFVVNDRTGIVDFGEAFKTLGILDLVTVGSTDSDTVELVRIDSFTNSAVETAEATTTSNGAKPESAATAAIKQFPVQTIPHGIPVTKRALSDAAQMETYIRQMLEYGIRERLNSQMLNGDGVAPNIEGLGAITGVQTQAFDTTLLTTMRKARTLVRSVGKTAPTGYAISPEDWETLELQVDDNGQYYFGGPTGLGVRTLWGVPVVEDATLAASTAYVANWQMAYLWVREDVTIQAFEQHSDWANRNIALLLAEMRAAFGVQRPKAFVKITTA